MTDVDAESAAPTKIWLVRHGETEWSRNGRHTGTSDIPLTALGEQQARDLRSILGGIDFSVVLCSPLERARRTAELAGFEQVELVEDLAEWDYGDYEGKTREEIRGERPDWDLWTDGCPGGESPDEVSGRVDRVIQLCSKVGGRVLLVAHGHVLRSLSARWIDQPVAVGAHLELATARVSVLGDDRGTPTLELWNATHVNPDNESPEPGGTES